MTQRTCTVFFFGKQIHTVDLEINQETTALHSENGGNGKV